MIDIEWKGKIGYGDIISPLCYAHVVAQKNCDDVKLTIHWTHSRGEKYKDSDPETLEDRFKTLWRHCAPISYQSVHFEQSFNFKEKWNHTNYVDDGPFHNFWYSKTRNQDNNLNYVVLTTTDKNQQTLEEYGGEGKTWKDPVGVEGFKNLERIITENWGMKVYKTDYTTPIDEAIDMYRKAFLAIGYHGSTMWLAKYLRVPMVVFSTSKLTKRAFPFCLHKNELKLEEFKNLDPYALRKMGKQRIIELENQLQLYLSTPSKLNGEKT